LLNPESDLLDGRKPLQEYQALNLDSLFKSIQFQNPLDSGAVNETNEKNRTSAPIALVDVGNCLPTGLLRRSTCVN